MSFKTAFATTLTALALTQAAQAGSMSHTADSHSTHAHATHQADAPVAQLGDLRIHDAYARTSSPVAKAGAVFFMIENSGHMADRLIAASAEIAKRVELHTHTMTGDGVMQMGEVEGGFEIPAHGKHMLARGGDHVMLMGLSAPWENGDEITLTLQFEQAGEVTFTVPVDLDRQDGMAHGTHKHDH